MTSPSNPIQIRKLGHVALYCRDLQKMLDFYINVIGFKLSDVNARGMRFLRYGADHHTLVLLQYPDGEAGKGGSALHHFALEVANLDELKQIRKYLLAQGVTASKIQHEGPGMNYVINVKDPDGNEFQFFSDMDQIGWDGKSRPESEWNRFTVED